MTDEKRDGIESARVTIVSLLRLPVDTPWLDVLTEVTRLRDLAPTPKPTPTLDLPPAPEGLTWGRAYLSLTFHLFRLGHRFGDDIPRACGEGGFVHVVRTKITPKSRACPACLAIARGEK